MNIGMCGLVKHISIEENGELTLTSHMDKESKYGRMMEGCTGVILKTVRSLDMADWWLAMMRIKAMNMKDGG